jgi:methionyl-tRNA formyltransferase
MANYSSIRQKKLEMQILTKIKGEQMKIIFMGTPEFSVLPLEELVRVGHEIPLVITQPDRVNHRGNKISFSPVKQKALDLKLRLSQPEVIKNNTELLNNISEINPDCIVVSAYGRILPSSILNIPKFGCINIHASLLPKYRGAAPIQWSVINGEEYTGVSIMKMEEGLDTGPVYAMEKTIVEEKTGAELFIELSRMGSKLLIETLDKLETGEIMPVPQDDQMASYARLLIKEDGLIDFRKKPVEIARLIRAISPNIKVYTNYKDVKLIITEAKALEEDNQASQGTITEVSKLGIGVSCGGKTLLITRIQFPGKKEMPVSDYLIGNKIDLFQVLK